jgi:hypothetical protein
MFSVSMSRAMQLLLDSGASSPLIRSQGQSISLKYSPESAGAADAEK